MNLMVLSATEALVKRDELVTRGYTSIRGVMPPAMVEELRAWSDEIFARTQRLIRAGSATLGHNGS